MTTKINILHVAHIADAQYSGVAVVVPNYLKYQSEYANVAFLNLIDYTPYESENRYVTHHYTGESVATLPEPFCAPDLVVFHEVYRPAYAKIAGELRRRGIPYIITPHVSLTDTAQHHKRLKKIVGNALMFNKFIYGAAAIHYLSESEKSQSTVFKKIPSFICNNGIELQGRMKKSFSKDGLKLIYVGRLEIKIKGIDRILDAANFAQDEMREKQISIAIRGYDEGNDTVWIEEIIKKYGIGDIVTLGGPLFGDEKTREILAHDCFLQLSRTEGQPLAIMEAMDIGMPCIVTEGTTFAEVMRENGCGRAVDDNPDKVGASILDISSMLNADFIHMSQAASGYAGREFEWGTVAKKMTEKYKAVIEVR